MASFPSQLTSQFSQSPAVGQQPVAYQNTVSYRHTIMVRNGEFR